MPVEDHYSAISNILVGVGRDIIEPGFHESKPGHLKHDGTPVTVYDGQAQARIKAEIEAQISNSLCLGEESLGGCITPSHLADASEDTQRLLVTDPIDGTGNFTRGNPDFASMIALINDGIPQAGWIYDPLTHEMLFAAQGVGVFYDGEELPLTERHPTETDAPIRGFVTQRFCQQAQISAFRTSLTDQIEIISKSGYPAASAYRDFLMGKIDFVGWGNAKGWDHLPGLAAVFEQSANACVEHLKTEEPYDFRHPEKGILVTRDKETAHRVRESLLKPAGL